MIARLRRVFTPTRQRVGAYVGMAVLVAAGFLRVESIARSAEDTSHALRDVVEVNDAQRCVNAWAGRADIRDMVETSYRRNADTLLGFAGDTPRADAYRAQVELDVEELRDALPNPECDLDAAEAVLAEPPEPPD